MVPLPFPGPLQKMSYQKSFIIPGEQGLAGRISYTIGWKKNSFFASFDFLLRPFATTKSTDNFRKIILIHLSKKMTGELRLFPQSPRYNQKEKIVSFRLRNFQLLEVSFPLCCIKDYCRWNWYISTSFFILFFLQLKPMNHLSLHLRSLPDRLPISLGDLREFAGVAHNFAYVHAYFVKNAPMMKEMYTY